VHIFYKNILALFLIYERICAMYRENYQYHDVTNGRDMQEKTRSEKIAEARRAFAQECNDRYNTYHRASSEDGKPANDGERYPFGLIRLMASGMLFLIIGIALYNNFSYNGFDKDYVMECLDKSNYWDYIVKSAGDMADKAAKWYNSLED